MFVCGLKSEGRTIGFVDAKEGQPSATTEREGVAETQVLVIRRLNWIFREQPTSDYGIDAQIKVVESGNATGRLIAAQIKSGPTYFKQADPGGWWFALDKDDLEYWTQHALPVIVVIYDPDQDVDTAEFDGEHEVGSGFVGARDAAFSFSL